MALQDDSIEVKQEQPPVIVELKSSSSKDGKEGYRIIVTNLANETQLERTVELALKGREKLQEGMDSHLESDLKESIKQKIGVGNDARR